MKRSSSAARSSSMVMVTRCIALSWAELRYDDLLTSSYRTLQRRWRWGGRMPVRAALRPARHHSASPGVNRGRFRGRCGASVCVGVVCARVCLRQRQSADTAGNRGSANQRSDPATTPEEPAPTEAGGTMLPTIRVTAARAKPRAGQPEARQLRLHPPRSRRLTRPALRTLPAERRWCRNWRAR